MFSWTYFFDHLVQTVFQFDGHIPIFYWGYKEHLQHREHLQIWLAVKDTLNIRYQVKNVIFKELFTCDMKLIGKTTPSIKLTSPIYICIYI